MVSAIFIDFRLFYLITRMMTSLLAHFPGLVQALKNKSDRVTLVQWAQTLLL
jgi:hypothetical protein